MHSQIEFAKLQVCVNRRKIAFVVHRINAFSDEAFFSSNKCATDFNSSFAYRIVLAAAGAGGHVHQIIRGRNHDRRDLDGALTGRAIAEARARTAGRAENMCAFFVHRNLLEVKHRGL